MSESIQNVLKRSGRPDRAEHDWAEFCRAYEKEMGFPLPVSEPLVHSLATLFGRSFFLSQKLIKDPRLADRLFKSEYLQKEKPLERYLEELGAAIELVAEDLCAVARVLRHYRYEETLRLTVQETAGLSPFETLGRERSYLATACIEIAYRVLFKELCREYGRPVDMPTQGTSSFCVLGMGKLGGEDLNYSSDIDLIYLYSSDEGGFEKSPPGTEVTHHQFFARLGEMLARLLSDRTEDGFCYRVDLGLRPEGQKGTLANSIDAMEIYYETFGDNWERMALVKATPVAGQASLGHEFCKRVRPFVYPRTADFATLNQVRDLKTRIEESLRERLIGETDPSTPGYNVKLGAGGIREIEFFVGSFQRLYGGSHPNLRARQTLVALKHLAQNNLISAEEQQALADAYRFLRTLENQLQMIEDRQTHTLPRQREDLEALAAPWTADQLLDELLLHTSNVRRLWDQLLNQP